MSAQAGAGPHPDRRQHRLAYRGPVADVVIARTAEQVEGMRQSWVAAGATVLDAQIDYFLTVAAQAPWVVSPYVVRLRREGRPDLFVIARIENVRVAIRIGYLALGAVTMRAVVPAFGGVLGAVSDEDEATALALMRAPLRSGEAEALFLRQVKVGGGLDRAVDTVPTVLRSHHDRPTARWVAPVPASLDEFVSGRSRRSRAKLRNLDRRLERDYSGVLRVRRYDSPVDVDTLWGDLESVASRSYQRGLGAGHREDSLNRALLELSLQRGWYRAWMLYLRGRPVAFWSGTSFGGCFATHTPGFDPAFADDSVGRYTMLRMVEDLCTDPEVELLDFGQGEAEYKRAFASAQGQEVDRRVMALRLRPLFLNFALDLMTAVNELGRRAVGDSDWGRRLKRGWRRRAVVVATVPDAQGPAVP